MTGWTRPPDEAVERSWRSGPRWWHVAVALVRDPGIDRRRSAVANLLGDLIGPSAPDHPHVTVWVGGSVAPIEVPEGRSVELRIGGAGLFATAAYLTVHSPELLQVRGDLARANPPEDRVHHFTPHLTVGVFQRRVPLSQARQLLAPAAALPEMTVAGSIRHLVVDTRSPVGALRQPAT